MSQIFGKKTDFPEKARNAFWGTIRAQGTYWCALCGIWSPAETCETIVTHPFVNAKLEVQRVLTVALCRRCGAKAKPGRIIEDIKVSLAERQARGGVIESDTRKKFETYRRGDFD